MEEVGWGLEELGSGGSVEENDLGGLKAGEVSQSRFF